MGWKDLLQKEDERLVAPWVGIPLGSLRTFDRSWSIQGRLPREFGWFEFRLQGQHARFLGPADPTQGKLRYQVRGYLVGDQLVPDAVRVPVEPTGLMTVAEKVHLIEPGLDRFVRISAGRAFEDGPLIYEAQDFPLGPEDDVQRAYQDKLPNVNAIPGVVPALDTAFRFESWRRAEIERIRREEEERRAREERERAEAERREQLWQQLGTGEGRREMAKHDFEAAARAALRVGEAEYLDHRKSYNKNEMVVQFRLDRRRFECVCHAETLRIIDAGICLVDHRTGEKGDTRFTLESLPAVIRQAERDHVLVVFRHVD